MHWIDAGAVDDYVVGGTRPVASAAVPCGVAVARGSEGFFAIEDLCTHDGAELAGGAVEGAEIICPRHGARFCLRTGEALSPPAYEAVRVFEVKVESGRVWVRCG